MHNDWRLQLVKCFGDFFVILLLRENHVFMYYAPLRVGRAPFKKIGIPFIWGSIKPSLDDIDRKILNDINFVILLPLWASMVKKWVFFTQNAFLPNLVEMTKRVRKKGILLGKAINCVFTVLLIITRSLQRAFPSIWNKNMKSVDPLMFCNKFGLICWKKKTTYRQTDIGTLSLDKLKMNSVLYTLQKSRYTLKLILHRVKLYMQIKDVKCIVIYGPC